MGEIVGAGLLAHVPTIMLPEAERRALNDGHDTTLVSGLERLRADVFCHDGYDTVVVLDSHWATTVEFVVSAHAHRVGLFTAAELPRGMCRIPYDYPGDPELARALAAHGAAQGTWVTAIDDPYLPVSYATINIWHHLGRGLPAKRWVSVSCCETADTEDCLRLGRALASAVAGVDRRVLLVASGALSHTFWPLREIRDHEAAGVEHIVTPAAHQADLDRLSWLGKGDHAQVLATMDDYLRFHPESRFAHYLIMVGALGGERCLAAARPYSEYENCGGTGQVHLWFDPPAGGWAGA